MHFLDCVWTVKVCVLHTYEGEEYIYDEIKEVNHHGESTSKYSFIDSNKIRFETSNQRAMDTRFLWRSTFQFQVPTSCLKLIMSHVWKHQISLYVKMLL